MWWAHGDNIIGSISIRILPIHTAVFLLIIVLGEALSYYNKYVNKSSKRLELSIDSTTSDSCLTAVGGIAFLSLQLGGVHKWTANIYFCQKFSN